MRARNSSLITGTFGAGESSAITSTVKNVISSEITSSYLRACTVASYCTRALL